MGNLTRTCEIRWFSGKPEPSLSIYNSLPAKELPQSRQEDWYLETNGRHTSIKLRQGLQECKFKEADDEPWDYGTIEHWVKWSSKTEHSIQDMISPKLSEDWIKVGKTRSLKVFEFKDQSLHPWPNSSPPEQGIHAEFTKVDIDTFCHYYTIGLEAWSASGEQHSILKMALNKWHDLFRPLENTESCGYPEFLSQAETV